MPATHIVELLEAHRSFSEPRPKVIAQTPALYERELAKMATFTQALARALQDRGVDPWLATLAASTGMAAFGHATLAWFADPTLGLDGHLHRAFGDLQSLTADRLEPTTGAR